jgi:hypothetical protein
MRRLVLAIFLLVLVTACAREAAVVCNAPYLLKGTQCCLDSDANAVCDTDASVADCPKLDCTKCPANVVERNVTKTVTKYVCKDGSTKDALADCDIVKNPFAAYKPVASNSSAILNFSARPACNNGFNMVEFHLKTGVPTSAVTIQTKSAPSEEWSDIQKYTALPFDNYKYAALCDRQCTSAADFFLAPEQFYLVRIKLEFSEDPTVYTSESIVDATKAGVYMTKVC